MVGCQRVMRDVAYWRRFDANSSRQRFSSITSSLHVMGSGDCIVSPRRDRLVAGNVHGRKVRLPRRKT